MRELGRCPRHIGEPALVGEQLGQPPVQPGPFPGQQVGVDGLAQQSVPERIAPVPVRHEKLVRDRLPDRLVVLGPGQP